MDPGEVASVVDQGVVGATSHQGYLELVGRSGRVRHRVAVNGPRLTIGRAYDNDLILDDPFVDPHHAVLEVGDTGVQLRDLGSVNGMVDPAGRRARGVLEVGSGRSVQLGRSMLRYRGPRHSVPPARVDGDRGWLLHQFERRGFAVAAYLLTVLMVAWLYFLESVEAPEWSDLASPAFGVGAVVTVWTLAWSLASRLVQHRWNFGRHCGVICSGILVLSAAETAAVYGVFAFQADWLLEPLLAALYLLGGGCILYAHLSFASGASPRRLAVTAAAIASVILGLAQLGEVVDRSGFNPVPEIAAPLKAPAFLLVSGVSPAEFFQGAETLREQVDREAAEAE